MTDQLDLLTAITDEAIARVEAHAPPDWLDAATKAVHHLAETRTAFTVDEVWPLVDHLPRPSEARAMGPVMRRAALAGWIRKTTEYVPSTSARSHQCPRVRWASLIVRPGLSPGGEAVCGPGRPNEGGER